MPELSAIQWEDYLVGFPNAHILQTRAWGDLKSAFGWEAVYVIASKQNSPHTQLGAQILFRQLPLGLTFAYIGKGPVGCAQALDDPSCWEVLVQEADVLCRFQRAIFLKLEQDQFETPAALANTPAEAQFAMTQGFRSSPLSIQPRRTLIIDLSGGEEHILARMKQKTRYNIRLAMKKGVTVHPSNDLEVFHRLMLVTGEREMFGVHSKEYYQRVYDLFQPRGECIMLAAEYQGELVSVLMAFAHGSRSWYLYGASGSAHRESMSTYLLQWEAMRWARSIGCTSYDLWGVPDYDENELEAHFSERSSGLWGVYRFKRGFGGRLLRSCNPLDRIYNPALYTLYRWRYRNRVPE
jgi:peptidoglycan pentaglycine glycine transferase (the first glycine)